MFKTPVLGLGLGLEVLGLGLGLEVLGTETTRKDLMQALSFDRGPPPLSTY